MREESGQPPVDSAALAHAVTLLRAGGIVAFPTETYYGLAVDPFNREALTRLFRLKRRPQAKPVLVLVRDAAQIPLLAAETPPQYEPLMHRFWPGPLTLIFPARDDLPPELTAGTGGIGIRQSPHPVANALLEAYGGPLTATSCNRSGAPPATTAADAAALFKDELCFTLDGGSTPGGLGSTILGLRYGRLLCMRDGAIPFDEVTRDALSCSIRRVEHADC